MTSPSLTRVYLQMRLRISGGSLSTGNGFWPVKVDFFLGMADERLANFCTKGEKAVRVLWAGE